ncbi:MAG: phosphoribosylamine--glycine ligase [Trueperaceae bacterium]|nr:phosphoribosylamine--glycine ligase [Trueperaceae bacterium]
MKVLLIGSGGREHALAWALGASPRVSEVLATPGNAGIAQTARIVAAQDDDELLRIAAREKVDLAVIGPEAPLAAGLADRLRDEEVPTFGPGRDGARLEASKAYAKAFMQRFGVPTAEFATFSALDPALDHLRRVGAPIVVKDSYLAAGKGVTVADTPGQAEAALRELFARPNAEVVLEERLVGQELSVVVLTDGTTALPLPLAQDHKQIGDGDVGPMTGGMGAVAPVSSLSDPQRERLDREIVEPVLSGLRSEGIDYRGALFLGVMWTASGPKLLEINVRLGDPETQTVLPLMENDLISVLEALDQRRLHEVVPVWRPGAAATVVVAAPGYPGAYPKDLPVGVPEGREADTWVFHAGTRRNESGRLVSSGGRILAVTAVDADVPSAAAKAYREVARIDVPGGVSRRDIGGRPTAGGGTHG